MNFTIKFITEGNGKLTEEPPGEIGIDMLDLIREELKRPNLGVDLIDGAVQCPSYKSSFCVTVDEKKARTIPLFSGRNKVTVVVPDSYLSRYEDFVFKEKFYDPSNNLWELIRVYVFRRPKRLTSVYSYYTLNTEWMVDDWKESGCPIKWGFNGENGPNAKKLAEKKNGKKS